MRPGMKGWLLLAVALVGGACATTTAGAVSNDPAQRQAGASAAPDAGVANATSCDGILLCS